MSRYKRTTDSSQIRPNRTSVTAACTAMADQLMSVRRSRRLVRPQLNSRSRRVTLHMISGQLALRRRIKNVLATQRPKLTFSVAPTSYVSDLQKDTMAVHVTVFFVNYCYLCICNPGQKDFEGYRARSRRSLPDPCAAASPTHGPVLA